MAFLYKKGPASDTRNYRGIALINHITKLYTGIISNRLHTWIESYRNLPEGQAGFRKGRSVADNIFTLYTLIQSNVLQKRKKFTYGFCTS